MALKILGTIPAGLSVVLGARLTKQVTLDARRLPPCRHRNGGRPHPVRWRGSQTAHGSGPLRPLPLGPTPTRKTRVASTGERLSAAFGQPALAPVLLVGELLGLAADRPTSPAQRYRVGILAHRLPHLSAPLHRSLASGTRNEKNQPSN